MNDWSGPCAKREEENGCFVYYSLLKINQQFPVSLSFALFL
jgi:hypothetical protein